MSAAGYDRVAFDFAGRELEGDAVDFEPAGDVSGPDGLLVVDVDGLTYRVEESRVERLDR
ncbi:hypothetical protein [Halorubrum distributum]|uniref:Uncharacterized protein n=1 Tax=Halorubrum distributum TaxID=29283 RepID=A0A6B1IN55_9EURY|nr:hypothetical protein [Halorubrum terrestre]MYL15683.1 hypothetical protein [Halorubrum terrestre]MYL67804.1 hypothetical protein [Halorubrum terrestre]